jgi:hypothetical protein
MQALLKLKSALVRLVAVVLVASSLVLVPAAVHAVDVNAQVCSPDALKFAKEVPAVCQDSKSKTNPLLGPDGILTKIIQVIIMATALVAVVVIVISGFRFVISSGDANSVKGARDAILYALIGLVVASMAQVIVSFVLAKVK